MKSLAVSGLSAIALSGDHLYGVTWSGLKIIDVKDPANPSLIKSVSTVMDANYVAVYGDVAFVTDGNLQIIDIRDPANAVLINSVTTSGDARGVAIWEKRLLVADGIDGVHIFDISDPTNPKSIRTIDTPGYAEKITTADGKAFVADTGSGIHVIDISQSPLPTSITGSADTDGSAVQIAVSGQIAYVADGQGGVQLFDVSNPSAPLWIGNIDTPGDALGLAITENILYVADSRYGLMILPKPVRIQDVSVIDSTSAVMTIPSVAIAGHQTLRLYNVGESLEIIGALTFGKGLKHSKAIIVAGSGPYPNNTLWQSTKTIANHAYISLLQQGYLKTNIAYLNWVWLFYNDIFS